MSQDITKENNFSTDIGAYGNISKDTIRFMKYLKLKGELRDKSKPEYDDVRMLVPVESKEQLEIEKQLIFINSIIKQTTEGTDANKTNAMNLYKNLVSKTGAHEPLEIAKKLSKFKLDADEYDEDKKLANASTLYSQKDGADGYDYSGLILTVGETKRGDYGRGPLRGRPPPPAGAGAGAPPR
jgi:hypothetical protein